MRRLRLRDYFEDPGDGRRQPQIPASALLWALLIGRGGGAFLGATNTLHRHSIL